MKIIRKTNTHQLDWIHFSKILFSFVGLEKFPIWEFRPSDRQISLCACVRTSRWEFLSSSVSILQTLINNEYSRGSYYAFSNNEFSHVLTSQNHIYAVVSVLHCWSFKNKNKNFKWILCLFPSHSQKRTSKINILICILFKSIYFK